MITVSNLNVSINGKQILRDFSAEFPAKITAVSGPSGSGKTTLLRTIAGLQKYTGKISGTTDKKIAFAFQDYRLFENLTAEENVRIVASPATDINTLLENMQMQDFRNKYPAELSGGMKQRTSIARAIAANADIILLDEPFSALDSQLKEQIACQLQEYLKDKTTIIVTHSATDINLIQAEKIVCIV